MLTQRVDLFDSTYGHFRCAAQLERRLSRIAYLVEKPADQKIERTQQSCVPRVQIAAIEARQRR